MPTGAERSEELGVSAPDSWGGDMRTSRLEPVGAGRGSVAWSDADVEIRLPARPESALVARHALLGVLGDRGVDPIRGAEAAVALSEAVTNAIVHGSASGGELEVRLWSSRPWLWASVIDDGGGIDPRMQSETAGLGLGIPLIISIADEVRFVRHEERGFEVIMAFSLEPREAS